MTVQAALAPVQTTEPRELAGPPELILRHAANPKIHAIVEHWLSLKPGPALLPGRQHLDPTAMPALLPNIWLIDVERLPELRFRYRLIGTSVTRAVAKDTTDQYLDEVHAGFAESQTARSLIGVVERRQPSWRIGRPTFSALKEFLQLERVYLPMARDGANVDLVLALTVFVDPHNVEF